MAATTAYEPDGPVHRNKVDALVAAENAANKAQAKPAEGSPAEEASESPAVEASEQASGADTADVATGTAALPHRPAGPDALPQAPAHRPKPTSLAPR